MGSFGKNRCVCRHAERRKLMMKRRTRILLFWCILALAFFARAYQYGAVPADLNQDEAFAGYNAYTLLHGGRDSFGYSFPMYLTAWGSGMNALESYLAIPLFALFGASTRVLRLVPLLLSMLTITAVYRMIREHMHSDSFALLTMFLTGVMPWHIMLSRWALESNLAPAFLTFGLYFFLKGMENQKYYILSALFYGLSLYSYATIWMVVPFVILAQVVYAAIKKKITLSGYTVSAGILLVSLGFPILLFIMVNKGLIDEIRTPVFSVPRLLWFRGGEVSFSAISDNLKNLFLMLSAQSDGLPWNYTEKYGLFYLFSTPFIIIGLIVLMLPWLFGKKAAVDEEGKKENGFCFFLLVQILAGLAVGALIHVNVNRVNLLILPLIVLISYGWFALIHQREWRGIRLEFIPVLIYLIAFLMFESHYFTEYREEIGRYFCRGLEPCMTFAQEQEADRAYISPNASYARILFLTKQDLDEYLETVVYKNYPSAFLDVYSFGKYNFAVSWSDKPDGHSLYVLDASYDQSDLVGELMAAGCNMYLSSDWRVYYFP